MTGLRKMMTYLCVIFVAVVLAAIGILVTILATCGRRPQCPTCGSAQIDEYPLERWCVCRSCGNRFDEMKRFGSHGGSDL
jgi:hypothetical protein